MYYYNIKHFSQNQKVICEKYLIFLNNIKIIFKKIPQNLLGIFLDKNEFFISFQQDFLIYYIKYFIFNTLMQIKILSDIIVLDYPGRITRFYIIYQILSIHYNFRFNVLLKFDELYFLRSLSICYKTANWYEREIWDMFGIFFKYNFDLRRILTDYSFDGHPLKKDFPLTGYFEIFYDDTKKRIFNISVSLFQDFRYFLFMNPWIL